MAINSISSGPSVSDLQALTPTTASSTGASALSSISSSSNDGVSVEISKFGQLRSDLASLAQNDPAQFKAVTADIAQKLKDAASNATGSRADALNKIAGRFDTASQSGNASDLSPASGGVGGHHHHGGHHRGHAGGGGVGATGDDGGGGGGASMADVVQGIISNALGTASTASAPASSTPTATTT